MDNNYSIEVLKDALEDVMIERNAYASVYRQLGHEGDKKHVEEMEGKIADLELVLKFLYA